MTTGLNITKLTNIFRGRWAAMYELLAESYKPALSRNTVKFMESIRDLHHASRWIQELSEIYKPAIIRNKEKFIEMIKENAEAASKSELVRKVGVIKGFYTLEIALPRGGAEMTKLRADLDLARQFIKTKSFLYLTVKQAWLLFLVCLEVLLWFFLGETIGKRHIVGYLV